MNATYSIVYILGPGHSGSTLIDRIINTSSEAISLGEVAYYDTYLKKIPHKKIALQDGYVCSCRKDFDICSFWKPINKSLVNKQRLIKPRGLIDNISFFIPSVSHFKRKNNNKLFYDTVYKESKKKHKHLKVIVDSSKDPRRLFELLSNNSISKRNIKIIYVYREPEAYAYSFRKELRVQSGFKKRSIVISTYEWIAVHLASLYLLKKYSPSTLKVSYHDLCSKTSETTNQISQFLGIPLETDTSKLISKINNTKYHGIFGNPGRFKQIKSISYDQTWVNELTLTQKIIIKAISFPFIPIIKRVFN